MARQRLPIAVRRTQVLDAALSLIDRVGYTAVSVEGIAREAGVSKTVVYDAYGGLDQLLLALLDREEQAAFGALAEADPSQGLVGWLDSLAHAVTADPLRWRLMLTPPASTPDLVRGRVQRGRDLVLAQTRAALGDLPGVDVELAARAVMAVAEEGARLMLERPGEFTPDRLAVFAAVVVDRLQATRATAGGRAAA